MSSNSGPGRPRLASALDFLNARYADPRLRLEQIARHVGWSPHYLSAQLKAETGVSFKAHLLNLRVEQAARLLESTPLSVKEIAAAVGYEATGSLDREFHRLFECRPSEWRRRAVSGEKQRAARNSRGPTERSKPADGGQIAESVNESPVR